jgi:hypothetical protein
MLFPLCPAALYKLTVNILWGLMAKEISSDVTTAPRGTVKVDFPPTVMAACGDDGWRPLTPAAPLAGRAMEAEEMGRSDVPKVFEIVILRREAPTDMWSVWRRVEFLRTEVVEVCE